jgi:hypothetical protein
LYLRIVKKNKAVMERNIFIQVNQQSLINKNCITIEQFQKKRTQRRRRVAKRQLKRFPLFAVEFMQSEFPNYDWDTFISDVTRKTRKGKSFRRPKSPLIRQGRYPLFQKAMAAYHETGNQEYLQEAQYWRNRLFLDFEVQFKLKGEVKTWRFPSTTSLRFIQDLAKVKFSTWDELEAIYKDLSKYGISN